MLTHCFQNDIAVPTPLVREPTENDPNPSRFTSFEQPIPIRNVRLVVEDRDTGREVIVSHVHADGPYMQRTLGSHLPSHTRYITSSELMTGDGLPIEIPWPDDHIEEEFRSTPADTGRDAVERGSWVPSVVVGPLGYDIPTDADPTDPMSAYTAGFTENSSSVLTAAHKLGLAGFSSSKKAADRQARIGKGIMDELRSKYARSNMRHDDVTWVQRKIIEDARSIWWKDRQIQSPSQEREQRVIKEVQEAREARIRAKSEKAEAVRQARRAKEAAAIEAQNEERRLRELKTMAHDGVPVEEKKPRVAISIDTERLIRDMQKVTLNTVYAKPDQKFSKKLVHMETQRQLGNTGRELRV